MDYDGSSSVYSTNSSRNTMSQVVRASTSTSSRPNSYTPSYMSNIQARPPDTPSEHSRAPSTSYRYHERVPSQIALKIPRRPVTTSPKTSAPAQDERDRPGLLLIVYAAAPHPSSIHFLETLLFRRSFAGIAIAGTERQEAAIKQLKIDIYALVGRLHKEVGVHTYMREAWAEADIVRVVQEATKASAAQGLHGVICSPELSNSDTTNVDVVGLSEDALHQSWRQSVGLLHALSKATLPQLRVRAANSSSAVLTGSVAASQAPFFLVAGSSASTAAAQITKPACDALLSLLEKKAQPEGVAVGYADSLLIPERTASQHSGKSQLTTDYEHMHPAYSTTAYDHDDSNFAASESPTKLWNMWAIQNDD